MINVHSLRFIYRCVIKFKCTWDVCNLILRCIRLRGVLFDFELKMCYLSYKYVLLQFECAIVNWCTIWSPSALLELVNYWWSSYTSWHAMRSALCGYYFIINISIYFKFTMLYPSLNPIKIFSKPNSKKINFLFFILIINLTAFIELFLKTM